MKWSLRKEALKIRKAHIYNTNLRPDLYFSHATINNQVILYGAVGKQIKLAVTVAAALSQYNEASGSYITTLSTLRKMNNLPPSPSTQTLATAMTELTQILLSSVPSLILKLGAAHNTSPSTLVTETQTKQTSPSRRPVRVLPPSFPPRNPPAPFTTPNITPDFIPPTSTSQRSADTDTTTLTPDAAGVETGVEMRQSMDREAKK